MAGSGRPASHTPKGPVVPPNDHGLLARLDALVALVADRHGLALLGDGRLAAAEVRVAVGAVGLTGPASRAGVRGLAVVERDAVELLRTVAEEVGLLRVRGDRLEATSLRNAWTQIDESLRAGLTYAAWCQQVTLTCYKHRSGGHWRPLEACGNVNERGPSFRRARRQRPSLRRLRTPAWSSGLVSPERGPLPLQPAAAVDRHPLSRRRSACPARRPVATGPDPRRRRGYSGLLR
jgi:hypothetical protein